MGARDLTAELAARQAIDALNARFAYLIDNGQSEQVPDLFTADGRYAIANGADRRVSTGQDAIRAAYVERAARGARTACHLFTNLHVSAATADSAHSHCYLLLFAQDGLPPHPAQLPPRGPAPTLKGAVQCVGASLFHLVPLNGSE